MTTRHTSPEGVALIKRFEGFRATPYRCPAGIPTIGYGSTRTWGGAKVTMDHRPISEAEAEDLLRDYLAEFEQAVLRQIKVPLTDGQFAALVSFVYNLGAGALQRSTLRQVVNRGDHHEAPAEFMKWTRGGGRVLPGLVKRRAAEAALYAQN